MAEVTLGTNSYVSESEATAYFDIRMHGDAWGEADTGAKQKALLTACLFLDGHIRWQGCKVDRDQSLEWPRTLAGDTAFVETPRAVKVAQMELAFLLLQNDLAALPDTAGFSEIQVDTLRLKVNPQDRQQIIPDNVFALVSHLGRRAGGLGVVSLGR